MEYHRSFDFTNNIVYTNSGEMLLGNLEEANLKMENNCYWDTRTNEPISLDTFFRECQILKDKSPILEDPGFAEAENFDFGLKSKAVPKKNWL